MSVFFGFNTKKKSKKNTEIKTDEYFFILTSINSIKLDKDYSVFDDIIQVPLKKIDENITSIDKVKIVYKTEPIITTVGKYSLLEYVPMIDIIKKGRLPYSTKIPCAGCRRVYSTCPLGIPIKYYPSLCKFINYDLHGKVINESVKKLTVKERKEWEERTMLNTKIEIEKREYFHTDTMVCSFNCMYFVINETPSILYTETPALIPHLYFMIFNRYPDKIIQSPSWKLRQEYGGPLTDTEFMDCLQTLEFVELHQAERLQRMEQDTINISRTSSDEEIKNRSSEEQVKPKSKGIMIPIARPIYIR